MEDIIVPDANTPAKQVFMLTQTELYAAQIVYVVRRNKFNVKKSAADLGIHHQTLITQMRRLGLTRTKLIEMSFLFGYFVVTIYRMFQ